MQEVLAPEFLEFGKSGSVYTREDMFPCPDNSNKIDAVLQKLNISPIDENTVLITYVSELVSENATECANRASIWRKTNFNDWKLYFHQGTAITDV